MRKELQSASGSRKASGSGKRIGVAVLAVAGAAGAVWAGLAGVPGLAGEPGLRANIAKDWKEGQEKGIWAAAPSLKGVESQTVGKTFFFPDSVAEKSEVATAAIGATPGQAPFSLKVAIVKAPTASALGEVKIVGGYLALPSVRVSEIVAGAILSAQTATVPEFVWAQVTDGSGTVSWEVYKVVEVAKETFENITYVHGSAAPYTSAKIAKAHLPFKEVILPANGVVINDFPKIADATEAQTTFSVKVVGTWQKTHYGVPVTGTVDGVEKGPKDKPGRNEGGLYYGYDLYVDGAEEVAKKLNFGLSGDKRDLTITREDLAQVRKAVSKVTFSTGTVKYAKIQLELGNVYPIEYAATAPEAINFLADATDIYKSGTVKLESGALLADSLAVAFNSFKLGYNLVGDLAEAGIKGLRVLNDKKEVDSTHIALDLSNAYLYKKEPNKDATGSLTITGEGLFANTSKDLNKKFELEIIVPYVRANNLQNPVQTIGKEWFKGTDLTIGFDGGVEATANFLSDVKEIGDGAFEGGSITFNTTPGAPQFSAVEKVGAKAFKGTKFIQNKATSAITLTGVAGALFGATPAGDKSPALKFIGDSAFANPTGGIYGIQGLVNLEAIGTGAFYKARLFGDTVKVISAEAVQGAFHLPFAKLKKVGAGAFGEGTYLAEDGGKFYTYALKNVVIGKHTDKDSTLNAKDLELDADAFAGLTVYIPYGSYEAWRSQITGSEDVKYYGFTGKELKVIRITDKFGDQPNAKGDGKYELYYGFNAVRTLSFRQGVLTEGTTHYSISGPSAFGASRIVTNGKVEMTDYIKENGISLEGTPVLPAGLYVVSIYQTLATEAVETALLRINPTELTDFSADTLSVSYAGGSFGKALKKFGLLDVVLIDGKGDTVFGKNEILLSDDATLVIDSIEAAKKEAGETHKDVLFLKGKGNLSKQIPIPVKYEEVALKDVLGALPPTNFKVTSKGGFKLSKDITLKTKEGFEFIVPSSAVEDTTAVFGEKTPKTWIEVSYDEADYFKPGIVNVTLKGHGSLTGTEKSSYAIKANWDEYAVISKEASDYGLGLVEKFNGLVVKDFEGLVKPLALAEGDYKVVAIPQQKKDYTTYSEIAKFGVTDSLFGAGAYDFYLIPTGGLKELYPDDAAYVGQYIIESLPLADLKGAAVIKKVVETTDEEGGSTTVTYTLSFKTKVFEGAFESELKDGVFTVTLDEKTAESISGLEGTTFEIAIPTGDPSGIEFIYPAPHKDKLWIVVGEAPTDLKEYLEATGGRVDYIEDVIWTSDREDKLTVTPEGILTAVTEWNGDIVASYVKTNGTKIEVTIHVGAVLNRNDIPTSTEAVTGVTKSITFAGGELKVKGYEGATVTVYSLNGSVVAHFIAGSGEASYGLGLNKGFYIAKVGSEVIKFVAK